MPVLIQWRREMEKFFERYFGEFYAMVFFYADMMFYYLRCRRGSLASGDPPYPAAARAGGPARREFAPKAEDKLDAAVMSPSAGAKKYIFS